MHWAAAAPSSEQRKVWSVVACAALALLPSALGVAFYDLPLILQGRSALELNGDGRFYAYQLAHAHELRGRWWLLGEDALVGKPYASAAAKHPGVYEGLDVLLVSSLTARWLSPAANLHAMTLLVLSFNGWVAGWITYRVTQRRFWAAVSIALITLNMSTAMRFSNQLHLIKYGWVLIAVWAMWRLLKAPSLATGAWLGLSVALVLQSSFYFGYFIGLALAAAWAGCAIAGSIRRRHWTPSIIAALTAALAGAAFTAPVWLTSRNTLLAGDQYFQRLRIETSLYGSQLWHYCITPAGRYTRRILDAWGANPWLFFESWHYLGMTVLVALVIYGSGRMRKGNLGPQESRFLRLAVGLIGLLLVLSLAGGPSIVLFDLFPQFRCYGRAGCLVVALSSVAAPIIWHGFTASWPAPRRGALQWALLGVLAWEGYSIATLYIRPAEKQHPAWAAWLARQPADVRAAVFMRYEGRLWEDMWHWDALNQSLLHRHPTLNGAEFALLNADLRQLGCSYWQINVDGLRFIVSLGYDTLVFHDDYLRDHAWIQDLPWLDKQTCFEPWHVFRASGRAPRFPVASLPQLLSRQEPECLRVPPGAVITDHLGTPETCILPENTHVRLAWATRDGNRLTQGAPALFQHVLTPHWPAFHIESPKEPGAYQLLFLDSDDRVLGARSYQVDAALQTVENAHAQTTLSINNLSLNEADLSKPLVLRIENTTPFYMESHRFDRRQRSPTRYHVALSAPGPGELHLETPEPTPPRGAATSSATVVPFAAVVPLPRDLPPHGHIDVVLPASFLSSLGEASAELRGAFHQAPRKLAQQGDADLRLRRIVGGTP